MGVDAIGLNCLLDPMLPLIEEVCLHKAVPIIAKPDVRSSDETLLTPESFAQKMRLLMQAGARIVGGLSLIHIYSKHASPRTIRR